MNVLLNDSQWSSVYIFEMDLLGVMTLTDPKLSKLTIIGLVFNKFVMTPPGTHRWMDVVYEESIMHVDYLPQPGARFVLNISSYMFR